MGLLNRKISHFDTFHEPGRRGRATIEEIALLNRGEFQVSPRKTARWELDETSMIRVKLRLRVELPGEAPYSVKLRTQVPTRSFARLGTGGTVGVVVNDRDPDRVAIDWAIEITEPTPEERLAANPVLRSVTGPE